MLGHSFAGLMGGADAFDGQIVRAANKWVFISDVFAGKQFRWTFDASADNTPEVGPAVLYGAIGSKSLAAVFQHGRAVGWFRGDQRAYVSPKLASRSKS